MKYADKDQQDNKIEKKQLNIEIQNLIDAFCEHLEFELAVAKLTKESYYRDITDFCIFLQENNKTTPEKINNKDILNYLDVQKKKG